MVLQYKHSANFVLLRLLILISKSRNWDTSSLQYYIELTIVKLILYWVLVMYSLRWSVKIINSSWRIHLSQYITQCRYPWKSRFTEITFVSFFLCVVISLCGCSLYILLSVRIVSVLGKHRRNLWLKKPWKTDIILTP